MLKKEILKILVLGLIILSIFTAFVYAEGEGKFVAEATVSESNIAESVVTGDAVAVDSMQEKTTEVETVSTQELGDSTTESNNLVEAEVVEITETNSEERVQESNEESRNSRKKESIKKLYEQEKKVEQLIQKVGDKYIIQYKELLAEGKSHEEAVRIINERFGEEFRRVYGEKLLLQVFVDRC